MKQKRLIMIFIFIIIRILWYFWFYMSNYYTSETINLGRFFTFLGAASINLILYNAPMYYCFILILEFIQIKFTTKIFLQMCFGFILGFILFNVFCYFAYHKDYLKLFSDFNLNSFYSITRIFYKPIGFAAGYILCYSFYGCIFPLLSKSLINIDNKLQSKYKIN